MNSRPADEDIEYRMEARMSSAQPAAIPNAWRSSSQATLDGSVNGRGSVFVLAHFVSFLMAIARHALAPRRKARVAMTMGTTSQAQSLVQPMPTASAVE